jgi:pyridoxine kinase
VGASLNKPAIIIVSSHVARGAVGSRAAIFALERLGFPVIAVPSVLLSWHPGDGPATRIVPPVESFTAIIDDLIGAPWLGTVGAILSGYLGEQGQAAPVAALVEAVKARNPDALYLCDPVIGDADGLYVSSDIVAAIGERLIPLADIATPNRHELGFLGQSAFADNDGIVQAARALGTEEVVVTSACGAPGGAAKSMVGAPGGVCGRERSERIGRVEWKGEIS